LERRGRAGWPRPLANTQWRCNVIEQAAPTSRESSPIQEEYRDFIAQIELVDIWLRSIQAENRHGPLKPDNVNVGVESTARWEPTEVGFRAFHSYTVAIESEGSRAAEVLVTFALDFSSPQLMTDRLFNVFAEVNLPVNTWPYLRAYLADMVARMGWTPLTLPAFKMGLQSSTSASPSRRPSRRKPRPRKEK
jgi:hypothetical protein